VADSVCLGLAKDALELSVGELPRLDIVDMVLKLSMLLLLVSFS
jgi:hypothetical protein